MIFLEHLQSASMVFVNDRVKRGSLTKWRTKPEQILGWKDLRLQKYHGEKEILWVY